MNKPVHSLMRIQLRSIFLSLGEDSSSRENRMNLILEDFYERMSRDTMIGFFFANLDLKHIAHQQSKFLLNAAGLIDQFEGKGPATAHLALAPILEGHFDRRLVILRETLQAQQVPAAMIELWISFESTFRNIVVSK